MSYQELFVVTAFLLIALLLGIDLSDDLNHGADLTHVILEATALLVSAIMLTGYALKFVRQSSERQRHIASALRNLSHERDQWKARTEHYLKGLGQAIHEQFCLWNLSESEKEIGLLILKGLSHKEIAHLRTTSERTVRQQAASLYAKAGIENKTQLAAFFLEDLMLPNEGQIKTPEVFQQFSN